jgi:hypothetical protein
MEKVGVAGGKAAMFVELIPTGTAGAKLPAFIPALVIPALVIPALGMPALGIPALGIPALGIPALGIPGAGGKPGFLKAAFPAKLLGVPIPG